MNAAYPTAYPELNAVLDELTIGARAILGANLIGVYLQGSFAVGDADEHSDVDFLVAVREEVADAVAPALQALHERIYDLPTPWAQHLEGSYVPAAILRREDPALTPLRYIDNGSRTLIRSTHDNTLVVRWVTREHGVALAGPPAATLIDPVDPDDLRREVRAVMRDWGDELLSSPTRLNTRWYQPFAVLSYCRMLHTLDTGRVFSKPAGARWARQHLAPAWHALIERAWAERPDPSAKVRLPADPADLELTRQFIAYARQLADTLGV